MFRRKWPACRRAGSPVADSREFQLAFPVSAARGITYAACENRGRLAAQIKTIHSGNHKGSRDRIADKLHYERFAIQDIEEHAARHSTARCILATIGVRFRNNATSVIFLLLIEILLTKYFRLNY
jgi:hypothetical protein